MEINMKIKKPNIISGDKYKKSAASSSLSASFLTTTTSDCIKQSSSSFLSLQSIQNDKNDINYDKCEDLSIQIPIEDLIKEFNIIFEDYWCTKSELSHDKLNKILAILAVSTNSISFDTDNMEITTLFINLSQLISTLESRSSLFWSTIGLLDVVVQNSNTKKILIEKFRYMQTLSKLLISVNNPDRLQTVLDLLENFSYGICITWQEPYLISLIKCLISIIYSKKENLQRTALSILINLCYNNLPSVIIVIRVTSTEHFLNHIQSCGILAIKMSFILEINLQEVSEQDIHEFIKYTFNEVKISLSSTNYGLLRHTIDFFLDIKSCSTLNRYFSSYPSYKINIQEILNEINNTHNEVNQSCPDQLQCLANVFSLLNDLLQIGEHLHEVLSEIVNCAIKWITYNKAGEKSLNLLITTLKFDEKMKILSTRDYYEIVENISHAMNLAKTIEMEPELVATVLNVILILTKRGYNYAISEDIFEHFIFNTIFNKLLSRVNKSLIQVPIIHDYEISMYMSALSLLSLLSENSDNKLWMNKLEELMKLPLIKLIITKAILHENPDVCALVFDLSKHKSFPSADISKILIREQPISVAKSSSSVEIIDYDFNEKYQYLNNSLNYSLEKQLNELIHKISNAYKNNEIGNIVMSDIMDLFEFKMAICANEEKDLLTKLDESDVQITNLSNKLSLLSAEVSKYQSENFTYQMAIERLKTEKYKLENDNEKLLNSIDILKSRLKDQNKQKIQLIKETELKDIEIIELQDKLSDIVQRVNEQEKCIEQLQNQIHIEETQCNQLEEQMNALSDANANLENQIHDKQEINLKHRNEVQELEMAKYILDQEINQITNLLSKKDDQLRTYSRNLDNVNDMRIKILKLVEDKKIQQSYAHNFK